MKSVYLKLMLPTLGALILGGLVIGFVGYRSASNIIVEAIDGDGARSARSLQEFVDLVLSKAQIDLFSIAATPSLHVLLEEEGSSADFERYMRELVGQFGIYNSIIVLNARGIIVASTSGSAGGDRADRDYFRASAAGRPFISQVEVSRQTGALSLFVSIPILNRSGEVFGVAMTSIKVEALNETYVVPVSLLGERGHAMIVNGAGTVIGHRDTELLGSSVPEELLLRLASVQEAAGFQAEIDGRNSMFFVHRSRYTDWYSIVVCPVDDFYTATTGLLKTNLVLGIAVIVILGIAISFVILRMTRPISNVANTLKDISQGEGDLTGIIPERGNDEIARMSHYFNETTKKIREMIVSIMGEARALSETGSDLADDMTQTKSAMNDIYANIVGIRTRMINQSASVAETNAAMEQITGNIGKLNDYVETQASSVSLSSAAIQRMLGKVELVTRTLVKNGENVEELTGASEIGRAGLLNVVSDI
ncbi:MAG: methyl-accepting chemotaxis protein, partial [Treponema sp.]|nr:methyl-accepting chemotaxis protein [Treponema sp.]